jgi:hypothetical protein
VKRPEIRVLHYCPEEWLAKKHFAGDAWRMLQNARHRGMLRGFWGVAPALLVLRAMLRWAKKIGTAASLQKGLRDLLPGK